MLQTLSIENFAIVKKLSLTFEAGMSTFTGETGAGKSIMIDALMLVLGARADHSIIRPRESQCIIQAQFTYDEDSELCLWLKTNKIETVNQIISIQRIISVEGRSKTYLNGRTFPIQKIKELSFFLVHIHGQHQHQTLLNHNTHRLHLDHYAKADKLLAKVSSCYRAYEKGQQELAIIQARKQQLDQMALLEFQIAELTALNAEDDEMQQLNEEHQLLHHAYQYLQEIEKIRYYLDQAEDSIGNKLNRILQALDQLPQNNKNIKSAQDLINSSMINCNEVLTEIQEFENLITIDPERLHFLDNRISELHKYARKYHVDANQLGSYTQKLQQDLTNLQSLAGFEKQVEDQLIKLENDYQLAAAKLHNLRVSQAEKLSSQLTQMIQQLGMPHGKVLIDISRLTNKHIHGQDRIEYKVVTNPGMQAESLTKIVSGGELSRISLAIQLITAQSGATPTLIFDEVDVGIGGSIAALVGQMLRQLGQKLQVFCVTHQAQVAAFAHHHFVVEKYTDAQQTYSKIIPLIIDQKIKEIARMLGGKSISSQTISHAQALLAESQE